MVGDVVDLTAEDACHAAHILVAGEVDGAVDDEGEDFGFVAATADEAYVFDVFVVIGGAADAFAVAVEDTLEEGGTVEAEGQEVVVELDVGAQTEVFAHEVFVVIGGEDGDVVPVVVVVDNPGVSGGAVAVVEQTRSAEERCLNGVFAVGRSDGKGVDGHRL